MDNTRTNITDNYQYLVERFGEERISSRYEWLYGMMEDFVEFSQNTDRVIISSDILNHVIVDYFVDIDRLKDFQRIEKVHDSKIYAYLCF